MSLTHVNEKNQPGMVDVSQKDRTRRVAKAQSLIEVGPDVMALLSDGDIQSKKGPVFHTAIIAGTMAAKKTSDLIPVCHPIPLEDCKIEIAAHESRAYTISIICTCVTTSRTGIEMEALAGALGAALTLYDMCKAVSKSMRILDTKLLLKTGGKSGDYRCE